MLPFLQQVVRYYLETQGLEDYCFIFPNRRSGQFFTHYLQRALVDASKGRAVPHLLPRVTSINELVTELTGTVAATDIEMMFALYDAYCMAMGDEAQEFDKFIYWAQLIISDFNDIDKSLADAADIYQNLSDLHGLVANFLTTDVEEKVKRIFGEGLFTAFFDTSAEASLWQERQAMSQPAEGDADDVKQKFMSLWNALADIYSNYHQTLAAKKVVSPGRQLRMAAENPPAQLRYERLVFVGFGVLSAAEMKLFDHFKSIGKADFWWDTAGIKTMLEGSAQDPGAQLIDGYCKHFDAKPVDAVENKQQTLRVVAVPSMVGQAKVAFDEVALIPKTESPTSLDTAIVLPDESLLIPLLHAVPPSSLINVTLGYPLRNSGIVSLMHIVARMHHQASKERKGLTYYREDVNDILSHPLIKTFFTREALDKATELARTNRFRVPAAELVTLSFGDLFVPAMDSDQQGSDSELRAGYLDRLLAFSNLLMEKMQSTPIGDDDDEAKEAVLPLQQAFLLMYIDVLNQLKRSLDECGQTLQRSSVFFLIDRLTASSIVAFTGEPLQGLQVMGLLETRSLDFKNVVVLSMNERIFPRRHGINSFIPNYMRRAHGMSTIEQQEAIMAYNFFRLLNRAENVTMVYDSSTQNATASSEPSRYITQLEMIYGKKLEHVEKSLVVQKSSAVKIQVPNTSDIDLQDRYTRDPEHAGGKYLSASAINKHINCPLNFYLHYVQGLNDDNELSDFMDSSTFGTIIHDTLNDCYKVDPATGHTFTRDEIVDFKKRHLKKTVERYIRKHYMHVPDNELMNTDDHPIRGDALMLIDTIISYVNFVLDYDLELIDREGPFTVLECEETHESKPLTLGDVSFNFSFKPDRIDRLANDMVRIVDYKTGKDLTNFSSIKDLFDNKASKGRRKAILQLFLYCYAYLKDSKNAGLESVSPVIYKIASMKDSGVYHGNKQYVFSMQEPLAQEFIEKMQAEVKAIYQEAFTQAPEGSSACNYCRFIDFCRRTPVVYKK